MSKPDLKLIQGDKPDLVEVVETPERVDFACYSCGKPCVMYPRAKPLAVQHSLPECKAWLEKDTLGFLIKCEVLLHVPKESN